MIGDSCACQVLTVRLFEWRICSLPLSVSLWSHFCSAASVSSYHNLHSQSWIFISTSIMWTHSQTHMSAFLIIFSAHSSLLHFAAPPPLPPPPPSDPELGDSSPGRGGVQHFSDAQEPREEPQHGRPAAGPLPGLPRHHWGRELQLHQRGARRQLPPARRLRGDAAPAARHHHWLLEACVRLRLHLGGDAQPAQPVQLRLGKRRAAGDQIICPRLGSGSHFYY